MTVGYNTSLRNQKLDAITTYAGNASRLRVYDGIRPATGGTATNLLAEFTLGSPLAPSASLGILSPTLPADATGIANGTATWFRIVKSDGTTHVLDGSVGVSGEDLNMATTTISSGVIISISSFSITAGNP